MLKLAYVSPMPPDQTGIADYSQALLPYLRQVAHVTCFTEQATYPYSRPLTAYPAQRWVFDATIYHMGNSYFHAGIYQLLCQYPGIVVLHDYILHHFISHQTVGAGNFPAYTRELAYEQGEAGWRQAIAIQYQQADHPLFDWPLNQRLLDVSLGVIVHSQYVYKKLQAHTDHPIYVIPMINLVNEVDRKMPPTFPHHDPKPVYFGCFGQMTNAKQLQWIVPALTQVRTQFPHLHLLLVGGAHPEIDLPALIASVQGERWITHVGHVPDTTKFWQWMAQVDVVLNLRYPTVGETSATAIGALALGKPLVVCDVGWYAELPDEICVKVPAMLTDIPLLATALFSLAQDKSRRQEMGKRAQAHIRQHHYGEAVAQQYIQAVTDIIAQAIL